MTVTGENPARPGGRRTCVVWEGPLPADARGYLLGLVGDGRLTPAATTEDGKGAVAVYPSGAAGVTWPGVVTPAGGVQGGATVDGDLLYAELCGQVGVPAWRVDWDDTRSSAWSGRTLLSHPAGPVVGLLVVETDSRDVLTRTGHLLAARVGWADGGPVPDLALMEITAARPVDARDTADEVAALPGVTVLGRYVFSWSAVCWDHTPPESAPAGGRAGAP